MAGDSLHGDASPTNAIADRGHVVGLTDLELAGLGPADLDVDKMMDDFLTGSYRGAEATFLHAIKDHLQRPAPARG